jgi:hypothetical protein
MVRPHDSLPLQRPIQLVFGADTGQLELTNTSMAIGIARARRISASTGRTERLKLPMIFTYTYGYLQHI